MSIFDRLVDWTSALRCAKHEAEGVILKKQFVKDAGFGDCPMKIEYEFETANGRQSGSHRGTESSYFGLQIGDSILVRYLANKPHINAPRDSLGIISQVEAGREPT